MIPLLLKPKLRALRNRWRRGLTSPRRILQDALILLFCVGLMVLVYMATHDVIARVQLVSRLVYLPPAQPLALLLLPLFAMLLFSNGVIAMGTLYLGADLELVLSSPLTRFRFFWGKFVYIMLNSSWMPFIFMLPVLLAFGVRYQASWIYYLAFPILLVPYFALATGLAVIAATVLTLVIPAHRTKEVMLCCLGLLLLIAWLLMETLGINARSIAGVEEVLRLITLFSAAHTVWLPSTWLANILQELLEPTGRQIAYEWLLLFSSAVAAGALAAMVIEALHNTTYSKARSIRQKIRLSGRNVRGVIRTYLPWIAPQHQALFTKEYRLFVREITQAVQLTLLLVLCVIYLYNLRIFSAVEMLPDHLRQDWKHLFFIGNIAMGSFIVTAVCTRFVFPSISLEGRAYWLLVSGPLEVLDLMRVKFVFWFAPVAVVGAGFFAAGASLLGASAFIIVLNMISALAICYGIVGVGIGLGAVFANFDWEHTSELAASFGSFLYMLTSILLIVLSIIPPGILAALHQYGVVGGRMSELEWALAAVIGLAALFSLNYLAATVAMKLGRQSLRRTMEA